MGRALRILHGGWLATAVSNFTRGWFLSSDDFEVTEFLTGTISGPNTSGTISGLNTTGTITGPNTTGTVQGL